jgi:5-(carboxyamino)imidazole ribonucleotide mutase
MAASEPQVAVIMGSKSDEDHLKKMFSEMDKLGIRWEMQVLSAHRQPEPLADYVRKAEAAGVRVFITAAGLSAALPGVVASLTILPVIGIPVPTGPLKGVDALLSMVQMPGGIPVATVGLGSNGPKNAAHLAAQILALEDGAVRKKIEAHREQQKLGS